MARKRSRKTPVSSPQKIDVVVKKAIAPPVEVIEEVKSVSPAELAWRQEVWDDKTFGGCGEVVVSTSVPQVVVDVWREDVMEGKTTASLAQWLKH